MQGKVSQLKEELNKKKKANLVAVNKLNDSLDVIQKVEAYIRHPADVLNKTRLFNEGLAKNLVRAAKVILILEDFNQKMEDLLINIQSLFNGLEAQHALPLDQVPNLSINTKELPTLQDWETGNVGQTPTPTKSDKPRASKQVKEVVQMLNKPERQPDRESDCQPEVLLQSDPQPTPTE